MKRIGYILFAAGFIAMVLSFCLIGSCIWQVPAIFAAGLSVMVIGLKLIAKANQKQAEFNEAVREYRHKADADKQQATDDIESFYKQLIAEK